MNTLSSLLNWIGETIGANPTPLATASKTIVGSINEVKANTVPTSSLTEAGEANKVPKITSESLLKAQKLSIDNNEVKDFVIAQGTSGDTSYRKWNSGILECWIHTTQNVAINSAFGSLYQGSWTWNFPTGVVFVAVPTVTCSLFKWGTSASWGTIAGVQTTWASLRGIDAYSRASGSCEIAAYAIGKWK